VDGKCVGNAWIRDQAFQSKEYNSSAWPENKSNVLKNGW
jgi:hypothetical protein